jgi:hypothetical protein
MLSAPMDPGSCGAQAHGREPGRLQANSKIENSVDTTGSNTPCIGRSMARDAPLIVTNLLKYRYMQMKTYYQTAAP